MANTLQAITEYSRALIVELTEKRGLWQEYLRTAARIYKYPFSQQVLIYGQRPDATACATLELWNNRMGRWVNRGSTGIALIDDSSTRPRLAYVFDVSDTHPGRYRSRSPWLWRMIPEYQDAVAEALENAFGTPEEIGATFEERLLAVSRIAVQDNHPDYLEELKTLVEGSFLEGLDDLNLDALFRRLLTNSVAFTLLARCGVEPGRIFDQDDFDGLYNFSTYDTAAVLGAATSDISKMLLLEIERTIKDLERGKFANRGETGYAPSVEQTKSTEKEVEQHDSSDLHEEGGLPVPRPDPAGVRGADAPGQVWPDAQEVPGGEPGSDLPTTPVGRGAGEPLAGGRPGGELHDGEADPGAGPQRGRNREPEGIGPDGLGGGDEQYPEPSGGDRPDAARLQVSPYLEYGARDDAPYFHQDAEKQELLRTCAALKDHRATIAAFFSDHTNREECGNFVKSYFDNTFVEMDLQNGQRVGYRAYDDMLELCRGHFMTPEAKAFLRWESVAGTIHGMILMNQWLDAGETPALSMGGQISLVEELLSEEKPNFTLPQAAIDYVLCGGSGYSEGKLRVYAQFQKQESISENAKFLKNEYGIGGHSDAIPGTGIWADHDTKGISLRKNVSAGPDQEVKLSWNTVAKRVGELIAADRYLTQAEKEAYPAWLEEREQAAAAAAVEETVEELPPLKKVYTPYQGDEVYLGSRRVEISSLTDDRVTVFEVDYPLLTDEYDRKDFIRMVEENPMNGQHLHLEDDLGPVEQVETAPVTQEAPPITEPVLPVTEGNEMWREYHQIKAENGGAIVFYQIGDFYESLGDDARVVAEAMELTLTTRNVGLKERVPMCGFPIHAVETGMALLHDRGYDVALAALENGERRVALTVHLAEKEPVQSRPIGRIDYLGTQGQVGESIEYTNPEKFVQDILEENESGVPMSIVLYRGKDGNTIPQDFVSQLNPPPQGFEVVDYEEVRPKTPLDRAKELIHNFCEQEYGSSGDFEDLSKIGIGYTTLTDEEIPVQINVDLVNCRLDRYLAGQLADRREYDSLEELIDRELVNLNFDDLIYFEDKQYDKARAIMLGENGSPTGDTPTVDKAEKEELPLPPPAPRVREKVAPTVLYPEIPAEQRLDYHIVDDAIGVGTPGERYDHNIRAIQLMKKLEAEHRLANTIEQSILAEYVGWGGLADCFDERSSHYEELKSLLTEEEYTAARESTLTAFYTPPVVARAMYQVLVNMGFQEGNILEPACGIGNFIGMRPEALGTSRVYGIELDSISARIAQQLYQKSSIAARGYEKTDLPDSFFDVAVGNVPFGDFKVADKRYDRHNFLIHDYFFARTLDKVRPGGIIAFVTSKGTMDKANSSVRKYIAQRADLLGAIRLPNDTFKRAAGTEVTSDILFLQKRDTMVDAMPDWVHLGTAENGLTMNQYFVDHPEMVLGEMREVSGPYGPETACIAYEDRDLATLLAEAIQSIHGNIREYEAEELAEEGEDRSIPADPSVRNFSYTIVDGAVYYRQDSRMVPVEASSTALNRIKGLIGLRDCTRKLIDYQTDDYPDAMIEGQQRELNRLYDAFVKKYDRISARANNMAFNSDSAYFLLTSLEVLDDEGNFVRKADMFTKRTIKQRVEITSVDTASEALAVSLGEKAKIDMDYMMELTGKTEEEIFSDLKGVIFLNPMFGYGNDTAPKYLTADEYLSGNVREKLTWAKRSAELYPDDYTVNVEALEAVQPTDLGPGEIAVRLGATWLPEDVVEQFIYDTFDTPWYSQRHIKVHFSRFTSEWNVEGKSSDKSNIKAYSTYGTDRINGYKIVEETLNLRDVRIFDYVEDENGNRVPILNKKETAIAQGKQQLIKQAFQDWVWADPKRRERLCKLYNEKFNATRPREYDGSHLTFAGINPEITLRPHQVNAIAHILYGGNTLLAHVVGAGKSATRS